jgi:hypothetical protein
MPKGFVFPPAEPDASEACAALQLDPKSQNRGGHNFNVLARLREGTSLRQARQEMAGLVARWGEAASPNRHEFSPKNHPVSMYPFYDEVVGSVRKAMLMLLGAVVFVLLIACVNVANLLLARSEARQREVAMRRAVGASSGQLLQQFVIEGVVLSVIGAMLGCLFAAQSLKPVRILGTDSIPRVGEIGIDWRVLCFALIVSILTGILFGLAPFVQVSNIRVFDVLKNVGSRSSGSVTANRFRHGLVIFQMQWRSCWWPEQD